jgi:hypothetical protein
MSRIQIPSAGAPFLSPKHLVLLPGLDGTGELFADFTSALPESWVATTVAYPSRIALSLHLRLQADDESVDAQRRTWRGTTLFLDVPFQNVDFFARAYLSEAPSIDRDKVSIL